MSRRRRLFWLGWILALVLTPQVSLGERCATGLRGEKPDRFEPLRPAQRRAAGRVVAPVDIGGGHSLFSEHFRLLWGGSYDRADLDWADPDADGVPLWIDTLADALESALRVQRSHGFPDPLGLGTYYVDVYVGNTGLIVDGARVTVSSSYYAYTEIDRVYQVAYLVVNDDFSLHTNDELGVLRATAAHELFHAVQAADYPWDDEVAIPDARWEREGWWFEATATWMEEQCEPDVDDYVTYVSGFLARPELPLTSSDGLREYGAAIFPGFLWLWSGGVRVWRETFSAAFATGVEASLDAALRRQGFPGFVHAVASFWSLAAHPEDGWPDGAAFRGDGAPRLLRTIPAYPFEETVSGSLAPGRFGASLFRVPPRTSPLSLRVFSLGDAAASFHVALSVPGEVEAEGSQVQALRSDGTPVECSVSGGRDQYLAVVNTEDEEGARAYRLAMEAEGGGGEGGGSGGAGGCFLQVLASAESQPLVSALQSKRTFRQPVTRRGKNHGDHEPRRTPRASAGPQSAPPGATGCSAFRKKNQKSGYQPVGRERTRGYTSSV